MKKQEQDITPSVARWFFKQLPRKVAGMSELKHTRGSNTCNLNEIKKNQTDYMESAESKYGFIKKHNDADQNVLPDLIYFRECEYTYTVIIYPEDVIVIRHNKIVIYRKSTNSLPLETAKKLASYQVKINEL